jgi:hypothetical protein
MAEPLQLLLNRRLRSLLVGTKEASAWRTEPIRNDILEILLRTTSRHWPTYIVGGAIRDLLLGPLGLWPRDIDAIVEGCSANELNAAFGDMFVRRTSFGGLHLRHTAEIKGVTTAKYDVLFDIWCLQDTWGIKEQRLAPTIESFLDTPFLNIDSVAVPLPTGGSSLVTYERGFFQAIKTRTLEINSEPNPFPFVCAVRALILAAKLDFWIGPRLASFIQTLMRSASPTELIQAQISHYGQIRCGEGEISEWIRAITIQLEMGCERVRLANSSERQMHLWEDWPPSSTIGEDALPPSSRM